MPTIIQTNATYWVEVPKGLRGQREPYYYVASWSTSESERPETTYQKPEVPWDQLWTVYLAPDGTPYFHNFVSRQTKWMVPGLAMDIRPDGPQVGTYAVARGRKKHQWGLDLVVVAPGYELRVYDPDTTTQAPSSETEEEPRTPERGSGWGVVTMKANGKAEPHFAWNHSTGEVRSSLPKGVNGNWRAFATEVLSEYGQKRECFYFVDGRGVPSWALPEVAEEVAECGQAEAPKWMQMGSVVRLSRLPPHYSRLEGLFATVQSIRGRLVRVALPAFYGPDYYELHMGCIAPLQTGMYAQVADSNGVVIIHEFRCDLYTQYLVRTKDNEYRWLRSIDLQPFVPVMGMQLKQPVECLRWKEPSEQKAMFIDKGGNQHTFTVHLPFGWAQWVDEGCTRPWPVLFHMHGNGGEGTVFHCTKKSLQSPGLQYASEKFVVISPDCKWRWNQIPHDWVIELVEQFRGCSWVDSSRVYITGCSMGGMSTLHFASVRPDLFAAAAPVAGYHLPEQQDTMVARLLGMPLLVAASLGDPTCPFAKEVPFFQRMLAAGCQMLSVYLHPDLDHCSMWEKAFCETEFLFTWLLAHTQ